MVQWRNKRMGDRDIKKNNIGSIVAIVAGAVMIGIAAYFITTSAMEIKPPSNKIIKEPSGLVTAATLNAGSFRYSPEIVSITLGNWIAEFNLELSNDSAIMQCDINGDNALIVYQRGFEDAEETGIIQDEILIDNSLTALGSFSESDIQSILDSKDGELNKTSENNGILVSETVKSLYKLGYVYVRESILVPDKNLEKNDDNTFKVIDYENPNNSITIATGIKDAMVFSRIKDDTVRKATLNLGSFGNLDLTKLPELGDNPGVLFKTTDSMVDLSNSTEKNVKVFISKMDNKLLGNTGEKLIPTEYSNVYIDYGWQNAADFGYRSLAVMTNEGMYYFKISESIEDYEEFAKRLIEWLGVKKDDPKIEVPYNITLTMDDMRPTLEEEESASNKTSDDTSNNANSSAEDSITISENTVK